ncbi:MAG: hypothetical protein ABJE47_19665 [bacterium]
MTRRAWRAGLMMVAGMSLAGGPAGAQVGRFPLFAPIAGAAGRCVVSPGHEAVPGEHANRTVSLQLDGEPSRRLSVVTNARGGVASFTASITASRGPSQPSTEVATAQYDPNGRLIRGERSFSLLQTPPARTATTMRAITPDESSQGLQLAKRVLERCGP